MIYLFNNNEEMIRIIPNSAIKRMYQAQTLTDENYISDRLDVEIQALNDEELSELEYMAIDDIENPQRFHYYFIVKETTEHQVTSLTGVQSGIEELRKTPVYDMRSTNLSPKLIADRLLEGTNWQAGYTTDDVGTISTNFYYTDVFSALKKMCMAFGIEMQFFVEITTNRIGARYIEFRKRTGKSVGKRVVYGHNALKIVKEVEKTNTITALIGRGKGVQVSESDEGNIGYGRKIGFENVEWKTSSGAPVDKPLGQEFVEIPDLTLQYGIKNSNGTVRPKVGFVEFQDEESETRLIDRTYNALLELSRPQVLLETSSVYLPDTGIGDTVNVVRHDRDLRYQTRVFEITWDRLANQAVDMKLGDRLGESENKRISRISNQVSGNISTELGPTIDRLIDRSVTADGKNTNWYTDYDPMENPETMGLVRVNDNWWQPDPEYEGEFILKQWNGEMWVEILRTSGNPELVRRFEEIEQQAQNLADEIETSDQKADEAKEEAGLAKNAVDAFGIITQETADKMVDVEQMVADAESNASDALVQASEAASQAGQAFTDAQTAMGNAQAALSKASDAESTVSTLSSEFDEVAGKVELKADKTTVDTLSGTVSTHSTTLTQHATVLSSKAEQSEVDTVKSTVSTHTSTLEQQATAISARLTQSQVNSLVSDKGYSTVSYVDNQMSVTAEGIRNEITAVEGKIPQSYTEENLVLNSKEYVSNNDYMIKEYNLAKELTVGKEYTIVLEGGISSTGSDQEFGIYFDNAGSYQGSLVNIAGAIYKKTFTLLQTGPNSGDKSKFMLFNLPQRGAPAVINWIKLVEGSVTDNTHTPSMSDLLLQNDFTVFKNTTENTIKAINNELSETAKKTDLNGMVTETTLATKNFITAGSVNTLLTSYAKTGDVPTATQFNSLKNRYDSMEQTIGTTNDSVARAVMTSNLWETEVSKVIDSELEQEYKTVTSKVNVVDGGKDSKYGESYPGGRYFYFNNDDGYVQRVLASNKTYTLEFSMQRSANKGTTVLLQVKHYGTTSWETLHTVSTTAGTQVNTFTFDNTTFVNPVSDYRLAIHDVDGYAVSYIWGFRVYEEVEVEVPVVSSETGAIGSKITQLYDMINLSVLGQEGAMSRIAMGEEGIQIDGKLLHITAKTFIDDAVIKTAMIDTIDAGKITTGELNASLVRVVNLDANSITGNEASFISALFSGTKSTLQITGSGVNVLDNSGRSSTYLDSSGIEFTRQGINLGKLQYVNNTGDAGDLYGMHGFAMRPNRNSYFAVSYFPTSTATTSIRNFAVSGRTGNVYIAGLIKPSEQQRYGIDLTWGSTTNMGANVRIMNQDGTGGIQINNGDLLYLTNGVWRSLNAKLG